MLSYNMWPETQTVIIYLKLKLVFCAAAGPPCGPIASNEKVDNLIKAIKPHIQTLKENLNTVRTQI